MPELPEVETHVRDLQKLVGYSFVSIWSDTPKAFSPSFSRCAQQLPGQKILAIRRRAKYIIFELSGGQTLIAHFRMTGHFLVRRPSDPLEKCVRHRFLLRRGRTQVDLRFDDIRKFGQLALYASDEAERASGLVNLGPEPLERSFTVRLFSEQIARKKGQLKAVLLDQKFVAGIGNIYADEICFHARLHPTTRVESLTAAQVQQLHAAIRYELAKGVKNRGTTIGEFMDSAGHSGGNQHSLRAYGRYGLPCQVCGQTLQKIKISQRTTSFCPHCQMLD